MSKKNWKIICAQCEAINGPCMRHDIAVCPEDDDDVVDIGTATVREMQAQNDYFERK